MNNNVILSIIIPVYNGEHHIATTLDSLKMSFPDKGDVEVIVVNDGSTDGTSAILEKFSSRWSVLVVINQNNEGVSSARNTGIKYSHGKYLYFMDSDDRLAPNFYTIVSPFLNKTDNEVIVFGFKIIKKENCRIYLPHCACNSVLESYMRGDIRMGIWSLITRRDVIELNNLLFDTGTKYGEDLEMIIRILACSDKIMIIKEPLYEYFYDNPSSAMNRPFSLDRFSSVESKFRIIELLKSLGKKRSIIKAAVNFLIVDYNLLITRNKLTKEQKEFVAGKYGVIEKMIPPFQLSKFCLFNLVCYLKRKFRINKISVFNTM